MIFGYARVSTAEQKLETHRKTQRNKKRNFGKISLRLSSL